MLALAVSVSAQKIKTKSFEINDADEALRTKEVYHRDTLVEEFQNKYFKNISEATAKKKKEKATEDNSVNIYTEVVLTLSLKKGNKLEFFKDNSSIPTFIVEGKPFDTLVAHFIKKLPEVR